MEIEITFKKTSEAARFEGYGAVGEITKYKIKYPYSTSIENENLYSKVIMDSSPQIIKENHRQKWLELTGATTETDPTTLLAGTYSRSVVNPKIYDSFYVTFAKKIEFTHMCSNSSRIVAIERALFSNWTLHTFTEDEYEQKEALLPPPNVFEKANVEVRKITDLNVTLMGLFPEDLNDMLDNTYDNARHHHIRVEKIKEGWLSSLRFKLKTGTTATSMCPEVGFGDSSTSKEITDSGTSRLKTQYITLDENEFFSAKWNQNNNAYDVSTSLEYLPQLLLKNESVAKEKIEFRLYYHATNKKYYDNHNVYEDEIIKIKLNLKFDEKKKS